MVKRRTTLRDRHRAIIARDRPRCAINGCEIDYEAHHYAPNSFTIDHIIPINRGGTDTLDNLQPACRACNRSKSDLLPGEQARKRHTPDEPPVPTRPGCVYETHRVW
jgi:5-methylcytosine-specific restriction endonuclease McrA